VALDRPNRIDGRVVMPEIGQLGRRQHGDVRSGMRLAEPQQSRSAITASPSQFTPRTRIPAGRIELVAVKSLTDLTI
jgi:hypothetical protein